MLKHQRILPFVSIAFLCVTPPLCSAVTIEVSPMIVAAFDTAGNAVNLPASSQHLPVGTSVFEVQLMLSVSDLAPQDQGFGNVSFNINTSGAIGQAGAPFPAGYSPINPLVDHDGSAFTAAVPMFADNGDYGVGNDLRDIVVGLDPLSLSASDSRFQLGRSMPVPIGKVYLSFNGESLESAGDLSLFLQGASTIRNGQLVLASNPTLSSEPLAFSVVPEPTTCILAHVVGMALAVCVPRRYGRR
jgi:hypothetical protein